ncbi:glycosyltransferase family 39 protein [Alloacidobacterium dinghuense]|uniref:Glycosyltransferase family 39 protein n=1 Tax=Alloacidobacterium dinghuense TaxID=2763107 RepID=A0A7G8BCX8_9BACT|nr:glycosyltransferase family 39 protein [Alloacidobacterium dinghuense]QNI30398.1 glycosyltransferase family 39 protein [Alloacidobacterium dinghuense]
MPSSRQYQGGKQPSLWLVFPAIFAAVLVAHLLLLRLPYYWDEAGYYIPAAYDFFRTGSLIPYSTLSNAHPPLPSLYLALWWKVFTFTPWVTRVAMCAISAVALLAVYRLAIITTNKPNVAAATVGLTALYPVWFAQSSLAHADMVAAAATLWALAFFLEERLWTAILCFSLAALAKETAIITPLALAAWQMWLCFAPNKSRPASNEPSPHSDAIKAGILLLPLIPLACWYIYHWHRTGFVFGNPEYLRYNATATLTPLRILLAFAHRVLHITAHMNLFVPVLSMLACMMLPPVEGRARISFSHQLQFYVIILANLILFSVLGGALLTRYLLPLYPLILLLCANTFYRRQKQWRYLVALSAVAFLVGLFINPPYRFAPEDNLAYRDVILLHQAAIRQIEAHYPTATVLSAWPATDELNKPELGYVEEPMQAASIDNFSLPQIERAAQLSETYTVGLIFSTKYDPPNLPFSLGRRNEALDTRFFDFHRDLPPEMIARLLGGKVVWRAERQGQWAAVLHFDRPQVATQTEHDHLPLHYNQP